MELGWGWECLIGVASRENEGREVGDSVYRYFFMGILLSVNSRKIGMIAGRGGGVKRSFIFNIMLIVSIYVTPSMDKHCSKYLLYINSLNPPPTLESSYYLKMRKLAQSG